MRESEREPMQVTTNSLLGMQQNNQMRLHFRNTGTISERLSSGIRINKGADDPSGLGITSGMRAVIGGLEQAIVNTLEGVSMIRTADSALAEIHDILMRGRDLAVRAANFAVNTPEDLARMQAEVDALVSEIDQIAGRVKFNTKQIINGGTGTSYDITTQADWAAGAQAPAGSLDFTTTPGSLKLDLIDPTTIAAKSTFAPNQNRRMMSMYITGYSDNGDGTINVTMRIRARNQAAGAVDYKGIVQFHSSATLVSLNGNVNGADNVVAWNAGTQTLDFNTGANRIRCNNTYQDEVELQLKLTKDPSALQWTTTMIEPSGNPATAFYFGTTLLRDGLPSFTVGDYLTDVESTGTWTGNAINTGNVTGGEAFFSYTANTPSGTQVQIQLYESADGVAWTALPSVENGNTFEYAKQFLRAEAVLTSAGTAFGTPELLDITIQLSEGSNLQVGQNNVNEHRLALSPWDARSAALGVNGVDVTVERKIIKTYDTATQLNAGIVSSTDIDFISEPGFLKLLSPIANQQPAIAQSPGPNIYAAINSAFQNPDGTFTVTMSLTGYGANPTAGGAQAIGWIGTIDMFNGDGSRVTFDTVRNISMEVPPPAAQNWPINPGSTSNTNDVNFVDSNGDLIADTYVGGGANGSINGTFSRIFFDWGTTSAQDGVEFTFTCDPDAYINVNFNCVGFTANHTTTTNEVCDIYFQQNLVADNVDGVPGSFNFMRRLQEYGTPVAGVPPSPPTGQFTTGSFYFGANSTGFLESSQTLNGGSVAYTVQESETGAGGWNNIAVDPATGQFTTGATGKYLRIIGNVTGVAATSSIGPGNAAYSYTQSATPVVDYMRVTKDTNAIADFTEAIDRVSQLRADIGIIEKRLLHVVEDLTIQRMNLISAKSTLMDVNMAVEAAELVKQQILNDSATAVKAQGDPFLQAVLDLQREHNVGRHEIKMVSEQ